MSVITYLNETKAELRHVNWPTRAQATGYTATVILVSAAVTLLLGGFDVVFNFLLKLAF